MIFATHKKLNMRRYIEGVIRLMLQQRLVYVIIHYPSYHQWNLIILVPVARLRLSRHLGSTSLPCDNDLVDA